MDILLSVQQVAGILGTSESTVRRMEEKGDIKSSSDGQYRFNLMNILSIQSEKSRIRTKMSISGVKAKDLKKAISNLKDDEDNVVIIIEEFNPPGEIAGKYLMHPSGFTSVGIFGAKFGYEWVI